MLSDLTSLAVLLVVVWVVVSARRHVRQRDREMVDRLGECMGRDLTVCVTDWRGNDFSYRGRLERGGSATKVIIRPHESKAFALPASRIRYVEAAGQRLDSNAVGLTRGARRRTVICGLVVAVVLPFAVASELRQGAEEDSAEAAGIGIKIAVLVAVIVWDRFAHDDVRS